MTNDNSQLIINAEVAGSRNQWTRLVAGYTVIIRNFTRLQNKYPWFAAAIRDFVQDPDAVNFERLKGHSNIFSIRGNDSQNGSRVLLTLGDNTLYFARVVNRHHYNRVLKNLPNIDHLLFDDLGDKNTTEKIAMATTPETSFNWVYHGSIITKLTRQQLEVLYSAYMRALLLTGALGSGKTLIIYAIIERLRRDAEVGHTKDARPHVIYVAPERLVNAGIRQDLEDVGENDPCDVKRYTYAQYLEYYDGINVAGKPVDTSADAIVIIAGWLERDRQLYLKLTGVKPGKNPRAAYVRLAKKIYQELRIASGYTEDMLESYLDLGVRQSMFENRSQRQEIWHLLAKYNQQLADNNLINYDFYRLQNTNPPDDKPRPFMIVDECQNLSGAELNNIFNTAAVVNEEKQVIYAGDHAQAYYSSRSTYDYIVWLMQEHHYALDTVKLEDTVRCPRNVASFIQNFQQIMNTTLGGIAHTDAEGMVRDTGVNPAAGEVLWWNGADDNALKAKIITLAHMQGAIIVAPSTLHDAVKSLLEIDDTALLLTPDEVLGLEADNLIVINATQDEVFANANYQSKVITGRVSRANLELQDDAPIWHQALSVFGRASGTLCIIEAGQLEQRKYNRKLAAFHQHLQEAILQIPQEKVATNTEMNIFEVAEGLLASGLRYRARQYLEANHVSAAEIAEIMDDAMFNAKVESSMPKIVMTPVVLAKRAPVVPISNTPILDTLCNHHTDFPAFYPTLPVNIYGLIDDEFLNVERPLKRLRAIFSNRNFMESLIITIPDANNLYVLSALFMRITGMVVQDISLLDKIQVILHNLCNYTMVTRGVFYGRSMLDIFSSEERKLTVLLALSSYYQDEQSISIKMSGFKMTLLVGGLPWFAPADERAPWRNLLRHDYGKIVMQHLATEVEAFKKIDPMLWIKPFPDSHIIPLIDQIKYIVSVDSSNAARRILQIISANLNETFLHALFEPKYGASGACTLFDELVYSGVKYVVAELWHLVGTYKSQMTSSSLLHSFYVIIAQDMLRPISTVLHVLLTTFSAQDDMTQLKNQIGMFEGFINALLNTKNKLGKQNRGNKFLPARIWARQLPGFEAPCTPMELLFEALMLSDANEYEIWMQKLGKSVFDYYDNAPDGKEFADILYATIVAMNQRGKYPQLAFILWLDESSVLGFLRKHAVQPDHNLFTSIYQLPINEHYDELTKKYLQLAIDLAVEHDVSVVDKLNDAEVECILTAFIMNRLDCPAVNMELYSTVLDLVPPHKDLNYENRRRRLIFANVLFNPSTTISFKDLMGSENLAKIICLTVVALNYQSERNAKKVYADICMFFIAFIASVDNCVVRVFNLLFNEKTLFRESMDLMGSIFQLDVVVFAKIMEHMGNSAEILGDIHTNSELKRKIVMLSMWSRNSDHIESFILEKLQQTHNSEILSTQVWQRLKNNLLCILSPEKRESVEQQLSACGVTDIIDAGLLKSSGGPRV